jgi:hypothetical protein
MTKRALAVVPLFAAALAAQGKVDFQKQVWPILQARCIECHAAPHTGADGKVKKPKGGVVLDSKDGMLGSDGLIVAKDAARSSLYTVVALPADDEDRMPPAKKGKPLSDEQQAVIKLWLDEGAAFGGWTGTKDKEPAGAAASGPTTAAKATGKAKAHPAVALADGLKPLPAATLAKFADGPFTVHSLGDGSPLLAVGCRGNADTVDDAALALLAPIASHVAELDLARTRVGDDGCKAIAAMPRLYDLDLRQTLVGNAGTAALAACKELRSLNLFGTKAGDYGVTALTPLKKLEQLYLWQTDASAAAVVRVRDSIPGLRVVMGPEFPEAMEPGAAGGRRRR